MAKFKFFNIFSCFPFRREKADMAIRSWLSLHKDEYDTFIQRMDNIANGDLSVLYDMFAMMKECTPPEALAFYNWLLDIFNGKADLNKADWAGAYTEQICQCIDNKTLWLGIDIKTGKTKLCLSRQPNLLMVHADTPAEAWSRLPLQVRAYLTGQLDLLMSSAKGNAMLSSKDKKQALEAIVFFAKIIFLSHAVFLSGFLANLYDRVINKQEPIAYCMYNFVVFDHGLTRMAKVLNEIMQGNEDEIGTDTMLLVNACVNMLVGQSIDMGAETKASWQKASDKFQPELWKEVAFALRKAKGRRGQKATIATLDELLIGDDKQRLLRLITQFLEENTESISLAYLLASLVETGHIAPDTNYMTFHRTIELFADKKIGHDKPQQRYYEIRDSETWRGDSSNSARRAQRIIRLWCERFGGCC